MNQNAAPAWTIQGSRTSIYVVIQNLEVSFNKINQTPGPFTTLSHLIMGLKLLSLDLLLFRVWGRTRMFLDQEVTTPCQAQ